MIPPTKPATANQSFETPWWLYDAICRKLGIEKCDLDAAASLENKKCHRFYDEVSDGLVSPWADITWCNPPYKKLGPWVTKALDEYEERGCASVLLLPARTGTAWFEEVVEGEYHNGIMWIRGRVPFLGPDGKEKAANFEWSLVLTVGFGGLWPEQRVLQVPTKSERARLEKEARARHIVGG